jgi:hypothetical protein
VLEGFLPDVGGRKFRVLLCRLFGYAGASRDVV